MLAVPLGKPFVLVSGQVSPPGLAYKHIQDVVFLFLVWRRLLGAKGYHCGLASCTEFS
jgi:hypothetical protein